MRYDYNFDVTYNQIYIDMCKRYLLEREGQDENSEDEFNENAEEVDYNEKGEEITEVSNETSDKEGKKEKKKMMYSIKDFQFVCVNVFQQEILKVCGLTKEDPISEIGAVFDEIWEKIFAKPGVDERFKLLILKYQDDFFRGKKYEKKMYRVYFGVLFDFNMFDAMHRCLRDLFGPTGEISTLSMDNFEMEVTMILLNRREREKKKLNAKLNAKP